MIKILALLILASMERVVNIPQLIVMTEMLAPLTNASMENANTFLLVMTKILAPLILAKALNVYILQTVAMILMHVLLILAILKLDVRTLQLNAMITIYAPPILAML
jgi:hypothetical protein